MNTLTSSCKRDLTNATRAFFLDQWNQRKISGVTKIVWNLYEKPSYMAKQRCSSTSRKGEEANLCSHHAFSVRGGEDKAGCRHSPTALQFPYLVHITQGKEERGRRGVESWHTVQYRNGAPLASDNSILAVEWFYLSKSHMLSMAGWLRRGCSISDVKCSSSSKQSTGLTDGCRRHGEWQEESEWSHHPVIAKRHWFIYFLCVYHLFARPHHLHRGTALG